MRAALALVALLALAPFASAHPTHQVLFPEEESVYKLAGRLAPGQVEAFRFVVAEPNVTSVEIALTWSETDDPTGLSGLDRFRAWAEDPDGRPVGAGEASSTGALRLRAPLASPPAPREADGEPDLPPARGGAGAWLAWVALEEAGPLDGGNSFELVVRVRHYHAVVLRVVALGAAGAGEPASGSIWPVAAGVLATGVVGMGVVLAKRRRSVPESTPAGDNTASPRP